MMKLNQISKAMVVALTAGALAACNSSDSSDGKTLAPANLQFSFGMENTKLIANDTNIPMPNDLYFIGEDAIDSTDDKLIIFGCGATNDGAAAESAIENATKCSLEDLDGWSTTAPFSLAMTGDVSQLDKNSFEGNIRLFVERSFPFSGYGELKYGRDFTVQVTDFNHLQVLPLRPFEAETQLIFVVSNGLQSTSGDAVKPSTAFNELLFSEPLDPLLSAYKAQIDGLFIQLALEDIKPENTFYIAGVKTQSIGSVLANLAAKPESDSHGLQSNDIPEEHLVGAGLPPEVLDKIVGGIVGGIIENPTIDPNFCDSSFGDGLMVECVRKLQATVELPYYLSDSTAMGASNCVVDSNNQANARFWFKTDGINVDDNESYFESYRYTRESCQPLYSSWQIKGSGGRFDPWLPESQAKQQLNVQVVLPNPDRTPKPNSGWPVVLFAHGITAAKEFGNGGMLLLDSFVQAELANQGYAVIAIDHPLHNTRAVDFDNDGSYEVNVSQSLRGLFSGHEQADVKNFLKADALLTSRDNLRQSIADLINLRSSLEGGLTYQDAGIETVDSFDTNNVFVMGHSMGAIAGASFSGVVAQSDLALKGSILANPGGGIGGILMNSVWLGHSEVPPSIKAMPEFHARMATELGLEGVEAVRQYAELNPADYKTASDEMAKAYFSEFQYLMQAVVDTVDPLNYGDELSDTPILSFSVTGSISEQPELQNIAGNYFTTADQTVPIKVEHTAPTMYEVCKSASESVGQVSSQDMGCFNGSAFKPYYSLNTTEFPLAGATPLEEVYGLKNTLNSTDRSYTRFLTGTHNIGAGTLTTSESEGNADYSSVDSAATELAVQAASFVEYTLSNGMHGDYIEGTHRIAPENLSIIER
ncbi:alpha/beta fold hydrolase [Photobacterium makurazakiensis]|uniref:alpha/beta fold hydrolase n=1 Tax=Photobacterium makurazakiensis TaxID=2910234 RepID=UPI003D0D15D5